MQTPVFRKSLAYEEKYPDLAFGLVLITGCDNHPNPEGFDQFKRKCLRKMRARTTLAEITARIDGYDAFFNSFGYECPLPGHLKRTVNSGFPRYNLMVDAHFLAEMCAGILVAAADYDFLEGDLLLDVAQPGDVCRGMGGREFRLQEGEIVFRDQKDIVCVLCQGADEKTRIRDTTRNVLFYAYAVPGIDASHLQEGLALAARTMQEFGRGTAENPRLY